MQTGLFEREDELGRIDALLALAQAGSGDMLLITGPAGIGKSVLLGSGLGARASGAGLADAAGCADRLAGIGVFEPGTPLRFVHSIVQTAVHDDIHQAERGLRHAEAARLLAAEGADPM